MSVRDIEQRLGIARSTLSYWFRDIKLSDFHKKRLDKNWKLALVQARVRASEWHRRQKRLRIESAKQDAESSLVRLDEKNQSILELALAMLYLGEGSKASSATALGNTNPLILNFFLSCMEQLYGLDRKKFGYELHLRADQNPQRTILYWSKVLSVPCGRFSKPAIDLRTKGRPTYNDYHGVCIIQCANVAVQRKLVYLSNLFCQKIVMGG